MTDHVAPPVSPWQTALNAFAARYRDRVAVSSRGRTLTYAQLAAQAELSCEPFSATVPLIGVVGPEPAETPSQPKDQSMNPDLRRRTDEVLSRLTHLRDSL